MCIYTCMTWPCHGILHHVLLSLKYAGAFSPYMYFKIQALESFVLRCAREVTPYCEVILDLSLKYVSYDPNFTDDMDEDQDEDMNGDEEEDE